VFYDAPCGDFNWMRFVQLQPETRYIGADIVPDLVEELRHKYGSSARDFVVADIVTDPLPEADVWLCRECLFHLPLAEISHVISRWRAARIHFLLATTTPTVATNGEVSLGHWRYLNLEAAPFTLGAPVERLPDAAPTDPDKVVGVWENTVQAMP
jgi:hypothetical protein